MSARAAHRLVFACVATLAACGGKARNADSYRLATQTLLETRSAQIRACYEDALVQEPELVGTVTVHFVVEKGTGRIKKATLDQAPPVHAGLGGCVVEALQGLRLEPPDRNDGQATFVYEFRRAAATRAKPTT